MTRKRQKLGQMMKVDGRFKAEKREKLNRVHNHKCLKKKKRKGSQKKKLIDRPCESNIITVVLLLKNMSFQ